MKLTLGPDFKEAGVSLAPPKKVDVKRSRADAELCGG